MKHLIKRKSPYTGKWHQLEIECEDQHIINYLNGAHIQNAFPTLNAEEREFVKTGYTPDDWTAVFGSPKSADAHRYVECTAPETVTNTLQA